MRSRAVFSRRRLRRSASDPSPSTQYTAGSFSQPLRRVFGSVLFGAREKVLTVGRPPARPAGTIIKDDGEGGKKIAAFLADSKLI